MIGASTTPRHSTADIRLCSGVYKPSCDDLPAVQVVCQVTVLNGCAYVWIDGVNPDDPILLSAQSLHNFRSLGTFKDYLENERHDALGDDFGVLLDLTFYTRDSATTTARALEIMHEEHLPPDQALVTARQWGIMLCELNTAERTAHALSALEKSISEEEAALV